MVYHAGSRRVVSLADGLDADSLTLGDEVFLNNEMTFVLGKAPSGISRVGETAVFDRYTADGRLILKFRDDELIADAAGGLQSVKLENGDQVRWDRPAWIAYEKIERAAGQRCFLDEVPDVRPEQVGGQRDTLNALLAALTTTLVTPRQREFTVWADVVRSCWSARRGAARRSWRGWRPRRSPASRGGSAALRW